MGGSSTPSLFSRVRQYSSLSVDVYLSCCCNKLQAERQTATTTPQDTAAVYPSNFCSCSLTRRKQNLHLIACTRPPTSTCTYPVPGSHKHNDTDTYTIPTSNSFAQHSDAGSSRVLTHLNMKYECSRSRPNYFPRWRSQLSAVSADAAGGTCSSAEPACKQHTTAQATSNCTCCARPAYSPSPKQQAARHFTAHHCARRSAAAAVNTQLAPQHSTLTALVCPGGWATLNSRCPCLLLCCF